ncbi:PREDICTED: cytochrome P450 76C4-like [Tarenaya hassleriana]|uniref:cytochrome P450 76C4-like n=1 Tax=Tarenaya hassleriana TaxID=28532 RepID=UPI00053C5D9D|nr:PREDICTED: cytochrome P450 76C4-like [Tarenaya hassleriana]
MQIPYGAVFVLIALLSLLRFIKSKPPARAPPLPPGPRGLPIVGNLPFLKPDLHVYFQGLALKYGPIFKLRLGAKLAVVVTHHHGPHRRLRRGGLNAGNLPFLKPDLHVYFQGLALKYGPIFKLRLGAKLAVVVTSPAVAREMFKIHDVIFANREATTTALIAVYGGGDLMLSPYGPQWRMLRKVCVHKLLTKATLDSSNGLRHREIRQTVRYLGDRARVGSPVNIGEQMFGTILNVVTQMLWGATVLSEEREKIAAEFRELVSEIVSLTSRPNISDFFPGLSRFDLQGLAKQMRGLIQRLDRMFDPIIDQRLRMIGLGQNDADDFLQVLLKLREEDETTPLSLSHVKALLMDMVLAGTETSSNTIEFAMAELISKPKIMKRVQEELDEVVGDDKRVEEHHISELPYLLAVVKESLRLHPVAPILFPHRSSQTTVIAGYTIPKDTTVFFNMWAIQRDPSLWDDPLEFNPDRFLDKSFEFNGEDCSYLPFGSGRRICAGIALAERTVLYNLATLLHLFDWEAPGGHELVIEEKFGTALRLKNPLVAVPVPRLSDPSLYLR